jgi:hypothetical protein
MVTNKCSVELAKDHPDRAAIVPIEQVFIFPGDIKALATTTTKFGISSKDVVGAFPSILNCSQDC